jgi:putative spermidine/putrescine transport system substrate-binding protein
MPATEPLKQEETRVGRTRSLPLALVGAAALITAAAPVGAQSPAAPMSMDELVAAAQAEGALNTIALPDDWCNYRAVIDGFKAKYGLEVNENDPLAGSNDELNAVRENQGSTGPQAPDVLDIGLSFGPQAKEEGLLAPYKVSTWDTIPDSAKDADGYWYGDYYGVLALETNKTLISTPPTSFADLLKPEYANSVALAGDPRSSNQAIQAVYASSVANGGSLDDASKGLEFWKSVVDAGNFVPVIATPATIDQGTTPITLRWSYNALAHRDASAEDTEIEVSLPTDAPPWAGVYVQAISAYAPHPNAAKLWMEYLYSDEGQLLWLEGYCYPIRFEDLAARATIPEELAARLPDVTGAVFPSLDQLNAASETIVAGWDEVVNVDVIEQ